MTADIIDREFRKLLLESGAYKKMGITQIHQHTLRRQLRYGICKISLDKKYRLLQRAGVRLDGYEFQKKDLVAAVRFALQQGASAQAMGAEYLVEKWQTPTP